MWSAQCPSRGVQSEWASRFFMPIIDLQCHFGVRPSALSVRPPELAQAAAYAASVGAETLCFSSDEAVTDLDGGNARLASALGSDARFRGWLTISVHQPDVSQALARQYLVRPQWVGARFDQVTEGDAVNAAGGHVVLNALRRYGRPVMLTVNSPATLAASIEAAREFHTLRFVLSPQNEELTSDALPAIKEVLNISFLPSSAFAERDILAQAVATVGERRVLWGSDWGRVHPAAALGMVGDSALTGLQRDRVTLRNARELLSGIAD
jgi:predicted TIM-barrel fold metal-dependent hydrolase